MNTGRLRTLFHLALAGMLACTTAMAMALEPEHAGAWFDPDRPGHGLTLEYSAEHEVFAVTWFISRLDRSAAFLSALENCERGSGCAMTLVEPSVGFMGQAPIDLDQVAGWLELTLTPDGQRVIARWDLRDWLNGQVPDYCNVSPGGNVFKRCVGKQTLTQLVQPIPPD